jgi:ABC-2 type transport system permease protein
MIARVRMGNTIKIARKEFSDLLNNGMIHVVLATFIIFIIIEVYNLTRQVSNPTSLYVYNNDFGVAASYTLYNIIAVYGALIGVIIGCHAITKDVYNNALNTLIVKPVYRDTIINGKLISIVAFLMLIITIITAFYTAALFIVFGNEFASDLNSYIGLLPVTIGVPLLYILIFVALSMLISLLINSRALGLILSLIIVYISSLIRSGNFAGAISFMFPGNQSYIEMQIVGLSPDGILGQIMDKVFLRTGIVSNISFEYIQGDIIKLVIFSIIPIVLGYIIFLRRDVT